jgi:hypothetical protein
VSLIFYLTRRNRYSASQNCVNAAAAEIRARQRDGGRRR